MASRIGAERPRLANEFNVGKLGAKVRPYVPE